MLHYRYKRHYVHLATWNEKSSDLVRQFRLVMNLPRRYITIPEKEFEWRIYLTICGWIASGMRKACAEYTNRHTSRSNGEIGSRRVQALTVYLSNMEWSYDSYSECLSNLINNNSVGEVSFGRSSSKNTNPKSYLTVLARVLKDSPNFIPQFEMEAGENNFSRWRGKWCSGGIGKLWFNANRISGRMIVQEIQV